ncbi:type II secretion system protein [Rubinisphaera margarita]|uniref:type II secretion system protein n=1 Tax=Rubinisphaera margarita TaxID=2909586 RepID=UPI001EE81F48|nr:type II secretion system protein [Rubinisphaera margarita]MCG6154311.1 type II secretion system GspH family protein [Rubinisphaera margarita]
MHPVHHPMRTNHHCGHRGFTLIELLVSISIVAILAGLLLTGIQASRRAVATAQCAQEIRTLETDLAKFQSEFGSYPPSSLLLYEAASDWNTVLNDSSHADYREAVRSRNALLKLWPDFTPVDSHINDDGDMTDRLVLDGAECLMFFLGGLTNASQANVPIGFSANPTNPFARGGTVRRGPYHEFALDRIIDRDGDGIMEYLDTLSGQSRPVVYFSSYEGRGYRPDDMALTGANIYLEAANVPWKRDTFQLISPGADGEYGTGGLYSTKGSSNLSVEDTDNITNFSGGTLR